MHESIAFLTSSLGGSSIPTFYWSKGENAKKKWEVEEETQISKAQEFWSTNTEKTGGCIIAQRHIGPQDAHKWSCAHNHM